MKMRSTFTLLLCFVGLASFAASVSGTVTNSSTSAPVAGQRIYMEDPMTYYIDSALTNSSGAYSINIPSWVPTYDSLKIYTYACGAQVVHRVVYLGANLTQNFSICVATPPTTYTIHGTVSLSGATNNGPATVYLISKQYDSVIKDTVLTLLDSIATAGTGGAYTKTYNSNPMANVGAGGALLLKAALKSTHPSYASYLPTYYSSALVWSNSTPLSASNFVAANATNINLISGSNPGGPGFVGGSVILGANKSAAVGDPLRGRIILLTNSTGQGVAYTYSDTNGRFSFSNLALGTYKIFGDAWGKTNPALTFTLTSTHSSVGNIIFEENSTKFEPRLTALAVSNNVLRDVTLFPNPVTDHLSFTGLNNIAGNKVVVLRDIAGAVLQQRSFASGEQVTLSTGNLSAGIYMLQLQTEAGSASFRVVK